MSVVDLTQARLQRNALQQAVEEAAEGIGEVVEAVPMPLDAEGIRMDALSDTLDALKAKGVTPKYIYTIPTIQNPTGSILPLERR